MKKNDKILIGALLGVTVVLLLIMLLARQNTVNGEAVVLIQGVEYGRYPLSENKEIVLPGVMGDNVLTISDGEAWMSTAVCPDKVCKDFGRIHYNTEMIICLPGEIVVIIENGDDSELDAVGK